MDINCIISCWRARLKSARTGSDRVGHRGLGNEPAFHCQIMKQAVIFRGFGNGKKSSHFDDRVSCGPRAPKAVKQAETRRFGPRISLGCAPEIIRGPFHIALFEKDCGQIAPRGGGIRMSKKYSLEALNRLFPATLAIQFDGSVQRSSIGLVIRIRGWHLRRSLYFAGCCEIAVCSSQYYLFSTAKSAAPLQLPPIGCGRLRLSRSGRDGLFASFFACFPFIIPFTSLSNQASDFLAILVAAAAEVDDDDLVLGQGGGEALEVGEGVGGFQRGENAFELGEQLKG